MHDTTWLENWIDWTWFDGKEHMDEVHEQHILESMKSGCTSGELVHETKSGKIVRGWWEK